jgi:hypothetical protein
VEIGLKEWLPGLPILFLFLGLSAVVLLALYSRRKEKERTQTLQRSAQSMGWTFAAEAPTDVVPGLDQFPLFKVGWGRRKVGWGRRITNFMQGQAGGRNAAVFDYTYHTGSGRSQAVHKQTVVCLELSSLNNPYFSLRPENFIHKIFTAFGYQDIDFGQRPNFSQRYLLRGGDEAAIRRVFNDGLLAFFESCPGTCADGGGNRLLIFRGGYRFQPAEIDSYLGLALNAVSHFPRQS